MFWRVDTNVGLEALRQTCHWYATAECGRRELHVELALPKALEFGNQTSLLAAAAAQFYILLTPIIIIHRTCAAAVHVHLYVHTTPTPHMYVCVLLCIFFQPCSFAGVWLDCQLFALMVVFFVFSPDFVVFHRSLFRLRLTLLLFFSRLLSCNPLRKSSTCLS